MTTITDSEKREIERILALREYARRDLITFFKYFAWPVIEPSTVLSINWAMELMADHLMALGKRELGEYKHSLLISVPPRHSKSSIATIVFPMWLWLTDPSERFLHLSYNMELAITHSVSRRDLVRSNQYQLLRRIDLVGNDQKTKFANKDKGVSYVQPKNRVTGKGSTGIIMDDMHSTVDTAEDIAKTVEYYKNGIRSRKNQIDSFKLIVMQRVGESDIANQAIEEGYYHLNIPAMDAQRRTYFFLRSSRSIEVPENTLIDPTRLTDDLETLQANPRVWATQYLQKPAPDSGLLFQKKLFIDNLAYWNATYSRRIITCDTASTDKDYSCNWAMLVYDLTTSASTNCLRDVECNKYEYASGKEALANLILKWNPTEVLIEDKSTGTSLLSDLPYVLGVNCPKLTAIPVKAGDNKKKRAARAADVMRYLNNVLPIHSHWKDKFLKEILFFPNSAYDDQVDSMSQFYNYIQDEQNEMLEEQGKVFSLMG